jgi:hypothetical protein
MICLPARDVADFHAGHMAEKDSTEQPAQPRPTFGQGAKRAGLFILFGTILVIPRIRRLRRRVWAWTLVRLFAAGCGGWLVWRYAHVRSGMVALAGGLLLLICGLLIRAKPLVKSVDAIANDLGALIVLNGGAFRSTPNSAPIQQTKIFVQPQQVIIQGPGERRLLEIPMAKFRSLTARQAPNGTRKGADAWEVEINWVAAESRTTTFLYEGPFAEHLAQVTESTLRSQWKKELPVFHQ